MAAAPAPAAPAAAAVTIAPKGKDPGTFDGDSDEYEAWKSEIQAYLVGVADKDKYITIALSFCKGNKRIGDWKLAFRRAKFAQNAWTHADIDAFWADMDAAQEDKNARAKAIRELENHRWSKYPNARDFFQRWEDLCDKAGHQDLNHAALLSILQRSANQDYIHRIYTSDNPIPTTYQGWKDRIEKLDKYHEQYRTEVQGRSSALTRADPFKTTPHAKLPAGTTRDVTGITYGGKGQPMELDRKCFACKRRKGDPAPGCTRQWHYSNRTGKQIRRLYEDEDPEVQALFYQNVRQLAEEDPKLFADLGLLTDEVHFLTRPSESHDEASVPPDRFPPDIPR